MERRERREMEGKVAKGRGGEVRGGVPQNEIPGWHWFPADMDHATAFQGKLKTKIQTTMNLELSHWDGLGGAAARPGPSSLYQM